MAAISSSLAMASPARSVVMAARGRGRSASAPTVAPLRGGSVSQRGANGFLGDRAKPLMAETMTTRATTRLITSAAFGLGRGSPKRKTVILTGASSGLGLATLKSLMEAPSEWHVVCGVRDVDKMRAIVDAEGYSRDAVSIEHLELKSKDSVHAFVKRFRGSGRTLDVLCCNAAVYLPNQPAPTLGDYGFEESLTVNHLSHFLLVNLMIKDLQKSKEPRCVIVGSITGNTNTVGGGAVAPHANLGNLQGLAEHAIMVDGRNYNGAKAYKDSKLANMMTMMELHRRYHDKTGIVFSSMYPGCVAETALFRQKRGWFRSFFPIFMKYVTGGYVSQEEAGARLAQCVADPQCNKSGSYYSWNGGARSFGWYNPLKGQVTGAGGSGGHIFENMPSQECRDERKAKKLWDLSERAVGLA